MALLVQKFCGGFFCQNSFPAILRLKKVPFATKLGGGGALVAGLLKKRFFFLRLTEVVAIIIFRALAFIEVLS